MNDIISHSLPGGVSIAFVFDDCSRPLEDSSFAASLAASLAASWRWVTPVEDPPWEFPRPPCETREFEPTDVQPAETCTSLGCTWCTFPSGRRGEKRTWAPSEFEAPSELDLEECEHGLKRRVKKLEVKHEVKFEIEVKHEHSSA